MGNRRGLLAPLLVSTGGIIAVFLLPQFVGLFTLLQVTVYAVMAILALSLALIWGFAGILCFGQAAFFGLGAYGYAVAAFNVVDTSGAVIAGIALPAAFAAALGYFMFYGRLNDVYVGVVTLVVTLILFKFMGHTAGSEYKIGQARLGGFNGIPAVPTVTMPGDPQSMAGPRELFYLTGGALTATYLGLSIFLNGQFGRTIVAIRENELRAQLLGYDVRLRKLIVFAVGGGIAGLAGVLFVNWGAFVSPDVFSLATTAKIIIWVIVGGLGTLVGPIIGAIGLEYVTRQLGAGAQTVINSNLVLGAILLVFVLAVPRGVVPTVAAIWQNWRSAAARRSDPTVEPRKSNDVT